MVRNDQVREKWFEMMKLGEDGWKLDESKKGIVRKESDIYGILPISRSAQYDAKKIIRCIVDNSEIQEYKA